jgi:nucleoside-diphosphate-sugar epimerase
MLCDRNEVSVFDNLVSGKKDNLEGRGVTFIQGSIVDYESVKKVFENADYVFHLAALASVPQSIEDPLKTNEVNVRGTMNVLVAAKDMDVAKVVFTSSSSVYGNDPILPKVETMIHDPQSPYATSKLAGEHYCRVFYEIYNLSTTSLRLFNVYGPRQDPKSEYAAVIPKFISRLMQDECPTIFGDGEQTRDFIYVKDVARAFILAAQSSKSDGETINIASGKGISINELATTIAGLMGKDLEPTHAGERTGDVKHSVAAIGLAASAFDFQPEYSLNDGLRETVTYWAKTIS